MSTFNRIVHGFDLFTVFLTSPLDNVGEGIRFWAVCPPLLSVRSFVFKFPFCGLDVVSLTW